MVIDKKLLDEKILQLEEYIQNIHDLRGKPKAEFTKGHLISDAAERRLEKAIQTAIDIAAHIVSSEALGKPTQYKDFFFYLGKAGIIDSFLTQRLEKMAGFRNLLIHEYAEIDPERVYKAVHQDIDDLIRFASDIKKKYIK